MRLLGRKDKRSSSDAQRRAVLPMRAGHRDHVWSFEFFAEQAVSGDWLVMLAILDEYTHRCLSIEVGKGMPSGRVVAALERLLERDAIPEFVRSDTASEACLGDVGRWLTSIEVGTLCLSEGDPWEGQFAASYKSAFREELANYDLIADLAHAKLLVERFRAEYNDRPQRSLGYASPTKYTADLERVGSAAWDASDVSMPSVASGIAPLHRSTRTTPLPPPSGRSGRRRSSRQPVVETLRTAEEHTRRAAWRRLPQCLGPPRTGGGRDARHSASVPDEGTLRQRRRQRAVGTVLATCLIAMSLLHYPALRSLVPHRVAATAATVRDGTPPWVSDFADTPAPRKRVRAARVLEASPRPPPDPPKKRWLITLPLDPDAQGGCLPDPPSWPPKPRADRGRTSSRPRGGAPNGPVQTSETRSITER